MVNSKHLPWRLERDKRDKLRKDIVLRGELAQALSATIYDRCSRWSDEKLKCLKADTAQGYAARAELTNYIMADLGPKLRKR